VQRPRFAAAVILNVKRLFSWPYPPEQSLMMKVQNSIAATRNRYNRLASHYDIMESLMEGTFGLWRRSLLASTKGKVLEVGVGTGKNFPLYPPGADVTGIDVAERMLALAKAKVARLNLPFNLREQDVQQLDFSDNTFDTAVATFVFCSVPDPVKGLRELRRVVKAGGRILLLEHVRIDKPIIGFIMDCLNPLIVRLVGANINRRTVENVEKAGLIIENLEHLGPMNMIKRIVAKPDKP